MLACLVATLLFALPQAPSPGPSPAAVADVAEGYKIGPDDVLRITVYGHEDLTLTVVVQSDGTITYPLVGRLVVSELTAKELAARIGAALSQGYIRTPQVTVTIQEYRSKQVFVVGEVTRPGSYPLSGDMRLVEVLSRAGPMTPNAGWEIVVVRTANAAAPVLPHEVGPGGATQGQVLHVNMQDVLAGHTERNIALRPGDTIFVPAAAKVYVTGEVRNPGAFTFSRGATVRQMISVAGGLTERASGSRLRVIREINGKHKELKIRLDDALLAGDTIVVKEKLF